MIQKGSVKQALFVCLPQNRAELSSPPCMKLMKTCICKEDRLESKFKVPKELYELLLEPLPLREWLIVVTP